MGDNPADEGAVGLPLEPKGIGPKCTEDSKTAKVIQKFNVNVKEFQEICRDCGPLDSLIVKFNEVNGSYRELKSVHEDYVQTVIHNLEELERALDETDQYMESLNKKLHNNRIVYDVSKEDDGQQASSSSVMNESVIDHRQITLPSPNEAPHIKTLDKPSFSGKVRDFPGFKRDYHRQIVDQLGKDPYTLKRCLSGEALDVVKGVDDDFEEMFRRLDERYGYPMQKVDADLNGLENIILDPDRPDNSKTIADIDESGSLTSTSIQQVPWSEITGSRISGSHGSSSTASTSLQDAGSSDTSGNIFPSTSTEASASLQDAGSSDTSGNIFPSTSTEASASLQDAGPSQTSESDSTLTSTAASASLQAISTSSNPPQAALLDPLGGTTVTSQASGFFKGDQRNMFRIMLPVDLCGCPLMTEIFKSDNSSIDSTESLINRIMRISGMSETQFKKRFNQTMRNKMTSDASMMSFDISTWYAVLPYACDRLASSSDNAWITPGTLENSLKSIKDFRNCLMHSRMSISDTDFHEKLEELRNMLVKAVQLWKSKFNIDHDKTDQLIRSFHSTIDIIRNSPLEDIDLNSFDKNAVFNSLKSILKREGTVDLKTFFKNFSQVNPAALLVGQDIQVEVEHIFTPLEIVKEGEEYFRNETYGTLGKSNEVSLDCILEIARVEGKHIILIEGIAGAGKTTIVKKILSDWMDSSSVKELKAIDYPLPVQCRDRNYDSVEKVVRALMPTARKTFFGEEHRMMECLFDSPLLFLFDGLDELTTESENIFLEVLEDKRNFMTICTMRPEKIDDVYKLISDRASVLHLRVEGVSEKNRETFIIRYCKKLQEFDDELEEDLSGLMSYLQTTGARMKDHWSLPLNLTLLTLLWKLDRARVLSITCPTELMIQIQELTLVRMKERIRIKMKYPLEELDKKIKVFVSHLSEIALTGIRDSNLLIPPSEILKLEEKCVELNIPSKELLGTFLIQRNSWSPAILVPYYMFTHKTIQEFYAATHIHNQVFQGQKGGDELSMAYDTPLNENSSAVILQEYELLQGKLALATTLEEVKEFLSKRSNRTVSVTEVLSKIDRQAEKPPSKKTYQGTLTILLGLLHSYKASVKDEYAREIIILLNEAGVKKPSDWITILNGVKCHPTVVNILLTLVNIIEDVVRINDVNVYAYATLLKHKMPRKVKVHINSRLSDTARIEELFQCISEAKLTIENINLVYQFYNPGNDGRFTDSVNAVLRNCRIERMYIGQVPSEDLLINIGDEEEEEEGVIVVSLSSSKDADSLFSNLRRRKKIKRPLQALTINVGKISSASMLQSIPQGSVLGNTEIYLPDVKEEEEDDDDDDDEDQRGRGGRRGHKWVRDILRTLIPPTQNRKFSYIYFPRYQGATSSQRGGIGMGRSIQKLLKSLEGIKVSRHIYFPSKCRPLDLKEEEQLKEECKKILLCRGGIVWGSRPDNRGRITDMYTWESTN